MGKLAEMDETNFERVFELNAKGSCLCMKEAAKRLNDNARSITISSCLVARPQTGFGFYIAGQAAVAAMTKALAMELGDRNFRSRAGG